MKKLTENEYSSLGPYAHNLETPLQNGEIGVCKRRNRIIICCGNCGSYFYINTKELLSFLKK